MAMVRGTVPRYSVNSLAGDAEATTTEHTVPVPFPPVTRSISSSTADSVGDTRASGGPTTGAASDASVSSGPSGSTWGVTLSRSPCRATSAGSRGSSVRDLPRREGPRRARRATSGPGTGRSGGRGVSWWGPRVEGARVKPTLVAGAYHQPQAR
jgi:hypothetical protein